MIESITHFFGKFPDAPSPTNGSSCLNKYFADGGLFLWRTTNVSRNPELDQSGWITCNLLARGCSCNALIFRKPLLRVFDRFIGSDEGSKIEVASVKIELGKLAREGKDAVNSLGRLSIVMAESRLLELEITAGTFGAVFSNEQREQMNQQIAELRRLTSEVTRETVE